MNQQDWRRAFGETPQDFKNRVTATLTGLEEEKMKKISLRAALIAAVIVVLLAGSALALTVYRQGVLDFLTGFGTPPLKGAEELVTDLTGMDSVSTPLVTYSLRDALLDHNRLLVTVVARANDPAQKLMPDFENELEEASARVVMPRLRIGGSASGGSADSVYEDGALIYYLEARLLSPPNGKVKATLELSDYRLYGVSAVPDADGSYTINEDQGEINRASMAFEVSVPEAFDVREYGPFEIDGATVDRVEVALTPVAVNMTADYSLHDDDLLDDADGLAFVRFYLVDGDAPLTKERPSGDSHVYVTGGGVTEPGSVTSSVLSLGRRALRQQSTWLALDDWPENLYLVPYYESQHRWGDAIPLK